MCGFGCSILHMGKPWRKPDEGMDERQIKRQEKYIILRKIININEDKCSGCGTCANACHEGAIGIVDGKA